MGDPETTDETGTPGGDKPKKPSSMIGRLIPLVVIVAVLAGLYVSGLADWLSFDRLRENHETLKAWVADNYLLAVVGFVLAYIVVVAVSLPGGAVMTLTGGFLFGTFFGGALVVIGATIGATIIFLVARTALAEPLRERAKGFIEPMARGFQENAFNYMLTLRLLPFFPFWAVNIAPAFLGVPVRTYIIATVLGIIPGTLVYASVGNGLGAVFEAGEDPDLSIIFRLEILGPILGLAALSLLPVIYRRFARKDRSR